MYVRFSKNVRLTLPALPLLSALLEYVQNTSQYRMYFLQCSQFFLMTIYINLGNVENREFLEQYK